MKKVLLVLGLLLLTACGSADFFGKEPVLPPTEIPVIIDGGEIAGVFSMDGGAGEMVETAVDALLSDEEMKLFLTAAGTENPVIIYTKSGGVVGITFEWNIYADGRVEKNGELVGTVHPAIIANLVLAADKAGFYETDDEYLDNDPCCDLMTYTLTVTDGRQSHTVTTRDGAPYPPAYGAMVTAVEALIAQTSME